MMVLSNDTITANQAPLVHHHNKMLFVAMPKDLHKKRFNREKKMRLRRCHSLPMDKKKQKPSSPKKNRRRSTEDEQEQAPLSSDRWGSSSSSQAHPIHHHDAGTAKQLPHLPSDTPSAGLRFTEGQTKKDSKIKPPTRQQSFEEDPVQASADAQPQPPRRGGQRRFQPRPHRQFGMPQRSKSNIETVVDMIDSVLDQLSDDTEEF